MTSYQLMKRQKTQILLLREALEDLLRVIETDELIPESVSYMKQARDALENTKKIVDAE